MTTECEIELEFNKLKKLTQISSQIEFEEILQPVNVSQENFNKEKEFVGDGQSLHSQRFKEVEDEVGHVWLKVETEVCQSIENQRLNKSQYNLEENLEISMIVNSILDEIISTSLMSSNKFQSKLNKHLLKCTSLFNSATAGVKRSFGIHNLHQRLYMKRHTKNSLAVETTVAQLMTKSNLDFGIESDSTEDMNKIELSEIEINVIHKEKSLTLDHDKVSSSNLQKKLKKKELRTTKYFSNTRKWFSRVNPFKGKAGRNRIGNEN